MILDRNLAAAVAYVTRDLIALRKLAGRPIPAMVLELDKAIREAGSGHGTESSAARQQSDRDVDLIGVREAAAVLGCSTRYVRRIAADLDGQLIETRWVFRRQTVVEYAEAKGVGDGSSD